MDIEAIKKGAKDFVIQTIWIAFTWSWYQDSLFTSLGSLSRTESRYVLVGCIFICCILAMILQFNVNGSDINLYLYLHLLIAYGVYTSVAYYFVKKKLILTVLIISTLLTVAFAFIVFARKIKNKEKIKRILFRRVLRVGVGAQYIFGVGFAIIMILLAYRITFTNTVIDADMKPVEESELDSWTIANNLEELSNFYPSEWERLSVEEKMDLCGLVVNIECHSFGIPYPISVGAANLRDGVLADYSYPDRRVRISLEHLDMCPSSEDVLNSITHECCHAYQHGLVEAYEQLDDDHKGLFLFKYENIDTYAKEFENYSSGEDYDEYMSQQCEIDAYKHGERSARFYMERIYEYLGEEYPEESSE